MSLPRSFVQTYVKSVKANVSNSQKYFQLAKNYHQSYWQVQCKCFFLYSLSEVLRARLTHLNLSVTFRVAGFVSSPDFSKNLESKIKTLSFNKHGAFWEMFKTVDNSMFPILWVQC